ncbi:GntR family transcriptional regulator [Microbacterium schleiferi]|jgi:DNA-binding GntR family transcriptional regulator|uniref:GntR family transcriptional regulator n=1 Tax=Microbacterium schleiferi TaxID=69362 RepID=A0ABU7V1L0_9MICO|nr:GntR family transcriptional regulator [Micrococcales bacterium]
MSPRRRDSAPGPTQAAALAEALRASILSGELGLDAPLREEHLAERYGASRHTVRAALQALAAERLVTIAPYRGARVANLDDDAVDALQALRGALETEAVRQVSAECGARWPEEVTRPAREAIDRLALAEASGDWLATTRTHAEVHRVIVDAAASPRITQAYRQLESEILLLLTHIRPDYPPGSLAEEHRAYLDEVQRTGGEAVRAHLAHSAALIRAARPRAGTDEP